MNNNNYIINKNIPLHQPFIMQGKTILKNNDNYSFNPNHLQTQELNINDISSIKSVVNYSTHLNPNSNNYIND